MGARIALHSLLTDEYLTHIHRGSKPGVLWLIQRALSRVVFYFRTLFWADRIILKYEVLPFIPPCFEWLWIIFKKPYVLDLDDAVYLQYENHKNPLIRWFFQGKLKTIARHASLVLCGSDALLKWAQEAGAKTRFLPTVINLESYPEKKSSPSRQPLTIGWIGSPTTAPYLLPIAPVLKTLCTTHTARLLIVGTTQALPGLEFAEYREWNEKREALDLAEMDVGIMPLNSDPWSQSKCGFKLIQYMASSLPVIATQVGANVGIVTPGENGYLVKTDEEWREALEAVVQDQQRAREMGLKGRERVRTSFCTQSTQSQFNDAVLGP